MLMGTGLCFGMGNGGPFEVLQWLDKYSELETYMISFLLKLKVKLSLPRRIVFLLDG